MRDRDVPGVDAGDATLRTSTWVASTLVMPPWVTSRWSARARSSPPRSMVTSPAIPWPGAAGTTEDAGSAVPAGAGDAGAAGGATVLASARPGGGRGLSARGLAGAGRRCRSRFRRGASLPACRGGRLRAGHLRFRCGCASSSVGRSRVDRSSPKPSAVGAASESVAKRSRATSAILRGAAANATVPGWRPDAVGPESAEETSVGAEDDPRRGRRGRGDRPGGVVLGRRLELLRRPSARARHRSPAVGHARSDRHRPPPRQRADHEPVPDHRPDPDPAPHAPPRPRSADRSARAPGRRRPIRSRS